MLADSVLPSSLRTTDGFSANVTSWRFPSFSLCSSSSTYFFAASSCLSEIESDTSTSTTVDTLLVCVTHDGRASAIAKPATTSERSVDWNTCCVIDRSVSDNVRSKKKIGMTTTRCSHCGDSRSIGRSPIQSIVRAVRSAIHMSTPIHSATPAAIAIAIWTSGPGRISARSQD